MPTKTKRNPMTQAPDFCYAAKMPCGCYAAVCYAYDNQDTGATLAEWKRNGWTVECHGRKSQKYLDIIDGLGCKCAK